MREEQKKLMVKQADSKLKQTKKYRKLKKKLERIK